jgi:hypothetical protein
VQVLDIYRYEIIDWDDPETDPDPATNNLLHCLVRPGESGGRYVCELLVSLPVSSA